MKKYDNNLYRVENELNGETHYFTSLQKIADVVGVQRTSIDTSFKRTGKWKHLLIDIVDGSEVKYKDIN